jgi:hypothetical protein
MYVVDPNTIEPGNPPVFHALHQPGQKTLFSGIYRCTSCGWEAVSTMGHPLPPQNAQHRHGLPILWQLVAASRHI